MEEIVEEGQQFTCKICFEYVHVSNKFIIQDCVYDHFHCTNYASKHMETQVVDYNNSKVTCIDPEYQALYEISRCDSLLFGSTIEKWQRCLCEWVVTSEDGRMAYCPYVDCSKLIVDECTGGQARDVSCPNCKGKQV
ncbi:uncharacterized protein LOC113291325 [Papaver somniferum]|uniref:uncharacterized protein LOC113291325 n=1 Tax=Papaver somniferum TaxID=3469 RepID=UPI000E6F7DC0|nr:uncharacterized protein LOC113291325 [Papaver somniferum]